MGDEFKRVTESLLLTESSPRLWYLRGRQAGFFEGFYLKYGEWLKCTLHRYGHYDHAALRPDPAVTAMKVAPPPNVQPLTPPVPVAPPSAVQLDDDDDDDDYFYDDEDDE